MARRHPRRDYHERLVAAFAEKGDLAGAAAAAGVSKRTASRWKAVPEFWAEVESARGAVVQSVLSRIRSKMAQLADEVCAIGIDKSEPAYVRVNAAGRVFEIFKTLEERVLLDQRIAPLEAVLSDPAVRELVQSRRAKSEQAFSVATPFAASVHPFGGGEAA